MKLVDFLKTINNDETIIKEKVENPDKHKLTLVNILNEMEAKKREKLIKKQI